jgi:hypothetical protein
MDERSKTPQVIQNISKNKNPVFGQALYDEPLLRGNYTPKAALTAFTTTLPAPKLLSTITRFSACLLAFSRIAVSDSHRIARTNRGSRHAAAREWLVAREKKRSRRSVT